MEYDLKTTRDRMGNGITLSEVSLALASLVLLVVFFIGLHLIFN